MRDNGCGPWKGEQVRAIPIYLGFHVKDQQLVESCLGGGAVLSDMLVIKTKTNCANFI